MLNTIFYGTFRFMSRSFEDGFDREPLNDFLVCPGTPEDIETMALLTERANAGRAGEPLPTVIPEGSKDYADLLERKNYDGYWSHLAFDGDQLAGFTAGYPGTWKGEDDGLNSEYLWLLMVDPDYQKRGLGRALLRLVGHAAETRGAESVVLYAATGNMPARKLYESEGYVQIGIMSDKQDEYVKYSLELG